MKRKLSDTSVTYLVANYGQPTETFVRRLARGLAPNCRDFFVLTDRFLGEALSEEFDVIECGFVDTIRTLANWCGRIGRLTGVAHLDWRVQRYWATRSLLPQLSSRRPDIALISFGDTAILALDALKQLEIPVVVKFHGRDASSLFRFPGYRVLVQEVFEYASAIVAISEHMRRRLVIFGCPEDKISVIYNGVDVDKIPPVDWQSAQSLIPRIVYLGRLTEKKGPDILVHAFKLVKEKVPQAHLTIIGDGPLRETVRDLIHRLHLDDSVALLGALPHAEALSQLSSYQVFAMHNVTAVSSGDQEGFVNTILEAAAAGLPIVSTLHNGIPENVVDGVTGYLVPEYDYETMAERIEILLQDSDLAAKMGRAGRTRAKEMFSVSKELETWIDFLAGLN